MNVFVRNMWNSFVWPYFANSVMFVHYCGAYLLLTIRVQSTLFVPVVYESFVGA